MGEFSEAQLLLEQGTGVGGSEIHHVMNEQPWGCRRQLFYKKTGVEPDYPRVEDQWSNVLRRGQLLEPIVATEYAARTGRMLQKAKVARTPGHPHRLVHVDRNILTATDAPAKGVGALEIKVSGEFPFRKATATGLPNAYILQEQWALEVRDQAWGAFAVFWADGWQMQAFDVERNRELGALLNLAVDEFWAMVLDRATPDRLPIGDSRCRSCPWRRTCWGDELADMLKLAKDERGEIEVDNSPELVELLSDFTEAKRLLSEYEGLVETIGARMKDALGERQAVEVSGRRVFFRQQAGSVMLDVDAMRKWAREGEQKLLGDGSLAWPGGPIRAQFLAWLFWMFGKGRKGARPLRIY